MRVEREDRRAHPPGATTDYHIWERQNLAGAIQRPERSFDIVPQRVIRRHVDHDIPKALEAHQDIFVANASSDLTPDHAARDQVSANSSCGQGLQRVLAAAHLAYVEAAIDENGTSAHRSPV